MPLSGSHHRSRVLTIGAAVTDVFVKSEQFDLHKDTKAADGLDVCFALGAKIALDDVLIETGGGATNAAVTFSRFGLHTSCVSRIGHDLNGRDILERLVQEGIETTPIQFDPKEKTGYSIILLSGAGYRSILTFRGAARFLEAKRIDWKAIHPDWVYLTSVAGNQLFLKQTFAQITKRKIHCAWNPGNAELQLGLQALTPWLMQTDILILNRQEAAELAGVAPRHLEAILHRLSTFPRQALIVTDGEHGAYVHARGTLWYAPALMGKRVNTTGAGDAFGSAIVAATIVSGNLEIGLRAGMLNSFGVITHMGAKAGILSQYPTEKDLQKVGIRKI